MTAPTYAEGDVVRVRNLSGLWRITHLYLVSDEVEVARPYGRGRRIVSVGDLLPRETEAQK